MEKFEKFGLSKDILNKLSSLGFNTPTEIQEKAIPLVLAGKDVVAKSATGSGKTLAFGLGMIHNIKKGYGIQALILTPTRELAQQVCQALQQFAGNNSLSATAVYGGVSYGPQVDAIKRAEIIVGTPGRILDHLEQRTLNLSKVKTLVLDEADRMLDMGFFDDVLKIVKMCPAERQTLLFSATIPADIAHIAKKYMKNPVSISAETYVAEEKLIQYYYDVRSDLKFSLLVYLLQNEKSNLAMVFCNTQRNTDFIARNLKSLGINALAIHGGHSQEKRTKTMKFFSSNEKQILVCTDVAARGLDIKGISHIYNYDLPRDGDSYIHRIGRTARAGAEGVAISLVSDRDYDFFSKILRDTHLKIQNLELPVFKKIFVQFSQERRDFRRPGNFRTEGRKDFTHGRGTQRSEQGRRGQDRSEEGRGSHERGRNRYSPRFSGNRNKRR